MKGLRRRPGSRGIIMDLPASLRERIDSLPRVPGVYLFQNISGDVLYVGKANSLRTRVQCYFRDSVPSGKMSRLRSLTRGIDFLVTETEHEALEMEYDFIRHHRPPFNVVYLDYRYRPYIKVTVDEPYPRVFTADRKKNDGARYFGPFKTTRGIRRILAALRDVFPYRSCDLPLPPNGNDEQFSVCSDYHLGRCGAPCVGKESTGKYRDRIDQICQFLDGHHDRVLERIEKRMQKHARDHRYEAAAIYRDHLRALRRLVRYQPFIRETLNADVVSGWFHGTGGTGTVLRIRQHRVQGHWGFMFSAEGPSRARLFRDRLTSYYGNRESRPCRIILDPKQGPPKNLARQIADTNQRITVHHPRSEEEHRLVKVVRKTSRYRCEVLGSNEGSPPDRLRREIQQLLDLRVWPEVMDGLHLGLSRPVVRITWCRWQNGDLLERPLDSSTISRPRSPTKGVLTQYLWPRYQRLLERGIPLPDLVLIHGGEKSSPGDLEGTSPGSFRLPILVEGSDGWLRRADGSGTSIKRNTGRTLMKLFHAGPRGQGYDGVESGT